MWLESNKKKSKEYLVLKYKIKITLMERTNKIRKEERQRKPKHDHYWLSQYRFTKYNVVEGLKLDPIFLENGKINPNDFLSLKTQSYIIRKAGELDLDVVSFAKDGLIATPQYKNTWLDYELEDIKIRLYFLIYRLFKIELGGYYYEDE